MLFSLSSDKIYEDIYSFKYYEGIQILKSQTPRLRLLNHW